MFVAVALAAAVLFAIGTVAEHHAAVTSGVHGGPLRLLWHLLRDRWWLVGAAAGVAGTVFQAVALRKGSLIGVEAVMALGVPGALALSAQVAGRRIRLAEQLGAVAVVVGVVVLVVVAGAPSHHAATVGGGLVVATVVGVPGVALLLTPRSSAIVLGGAGGVTFAAGSALLKLASVGLAEEGVRSARAAVPFAGFLVLAALGNLLVQRAFRLADLGRSLPALAAGEPLTALVFGRVLYRESLGHGTSGPVLLALALALLLYGLVVTNRAEATTEAAPLGS